MDEVAGGVDGGVAAVNLAANKRCVKYANL